MEEEEEKKMNNKELLKVYGERVNYLSEKMPTRIQNETDEQYKTRRMTNKIMACLNLIMKQSTQLICCVCLTPIDTENEIFVQCKKCPRMLHLFCEFRGDPVCPAHDCNTCRLLGKSTPAISTYTCCINAFCEEHLDKNNVRQCKLCKNNNFKC